MTDLVDNTSSLANAVPGELCLKVRNLKAGYHGKPVVEKVNLHLRSGEFVGLVGHNGSGKSTVLLGISGLTWASAESILINDCQVADQPPHIRARRGFGMLLQRDGLFIDHSVQANMILAGVPSTYPPFFPQDDELGMALQDIMSRRLQRAGSLSGGERRLLSLALILARRPYIILADEPTLGLSESLELAVMRFLRDYALTKKRAVLVVSHNVQLVQLLCSRAYVIERGVLVSEWTPGNPGRSLVEQVKGNA